MVFLCLFLSLICFFDYSQRRIPNIFVFLLFLTGIVEGYLQNGFAAIGEYLWKAGFIFLFLYLFFRIGALGAGDVKLLCAVSGYIPAEKLLPFLLLSFCLAAVFALFAMVYQKKLVFCWRRFTDYLRTCLKAGTILSYPKDQMLEVIMSGPILLSSVLFLGGVF